jgi:predicted nucleic acid-binding protein
MYKLLIDTNILLDSIVPGRPEHEQAVQLLTWCNGSGDRGYASATSFKDVYYIATKIHGEPWARNAVRQLMGLLAIAPVDAEVLDEAIRSNEPDFEDGIVRACAELNGADFIITRDTAAFTKSKVRAVSASEYLEIAS